MGLNVNYRLLAEGANYNYIFNNNYTPIEHSRTFSEAYMINIFSDFSREINESKTFLNSIYEDSSDLTIYTESNMFTNVINAIKGIIDKVIQGIIAVKNTIINFFKQILRTAKMAISSKKDAVEEKYKPYELARVLFTALNLASTDEKTVVISNIHPTEDLLNKDFPDTSIIGSKLVDSTIKSMNLYVQDYIQKSGNYNYDIDAQAAESLADRLHEQENSIAQQILGKYYNNEAFADISSCIENVATRAFGSEKSSEVILSVDLYNLAVDNLSKSKEVISSIEKSVDEVQKNYNNVINSLNSIKSQVLQMDKNLPTYNVDLRKGFNDATRKVIESINRILNVVQKAVEADYKLLIKKAKRINQIFDYVPTSTTGDSMRVKQACHNLILKYIDAQPQTESTFSGLEASVESVRMQEDFDSAMAMLDEAYMEQEFDELITTVLMETGNGSAQPAADPAGGDGGSAAKTDAGQQQQAAQQPNNQQQSSTNKGTIGKTIDDIIELLANTFNKFANRVGEFTAQKFDGGFWTKNRQKISSLTFAKTKVNQWHVYDLDAFQTDIVDTNTASFDINNKALDSDESMQNSIIEKLLRGTRPVDSVNSKDEKSNSFSKKIARTFETNYINNTGENAEVELGSSNIFDAKKSFNFVDDFVSHGFEGKTLGSIKTDNDNLKKLKDYVKNNNQQLTNQYHDQYVQDAKTAGADNKQAEPQNNSAEFDLAGIFGLCNPQPLMELDIKIDSSDSQTTEKSDTSARNDASKRTNDRINRYFKYTSYAITSKMTTALAAYKQYMALYKAAYKQSPKKEENNNQQPDQQNNTKETK